MWWKYRKLAEQWQSKSEATAAELQALKTEYETLRQQHEALQNKQDKAQQDSSAHQSIQAMWLGNTAALAEVKDAVLPSHMA